MSMHYMLHTHVAVASQKLGLICLPSVPPSIRFVSGGLRAMAPPWITVLTDERAPFLDVFSILVRVCVLLRNMRWWLLLEDEIRFFSSSPHPGDAFSIIGGCVEVCLRGISPRRICW